MSEKNNCAVRGQQDCFNGNLWLVRPFKAVGENAHLIFADA